MKEKGHIFKSNKELIPQIPVPSSDSGSSQRPPHRTNKGSLTGQDLGRSLRDYFGPHSAARILRS